ncbi:MAG: hypothetical protein GC156_13600 [Actinomycetales bacterium]|nr:hypothetical protein [Actinomycetales bacterium]
MVSAIRQYRASALGALLAIVGWLFLTVTGVSPLTALLLVLIVGIQSWAGAVLWRVARLGHSDPLELVGMGMAVGTVAALLSGVVVKVVTGTNLGWVLPALAAAIVMIVRIRRGSDGVSERVPMTWAAISGAAAALVLSLASLVPNLLSYPVTWTGTWGRYHPDMLFFESLSTSMAQIGPLDSIYTPDALIRYHWLVYAWAGQVSGAAGADHFVVLVRVLPFVAVVGAGLIAVSWVGRLTRAVWAPALAVVLLVAGGYVGATYGAIFNFDSPSQSMTSMWLLAFALAVVLTASDGGRPLRARWLLLSAVALLAFGLAGGKISSGAVALGAVIWLAAVGSLARRAWTRAAWASATVTAVAFALAYLLVVSGSADPGGLKIFNLIDRASSVQGLNPLPGSIGVVLGTALLLLAIAARWVGLLWLVGDRQTRWSVDAQLGVGLALAAAATVVLISGGLNDTWFALAASAPLAVLSAAGAGQAWLTLPERRWGALAVSVAVALVAFGVVSALWLTGASGGNVWVSTWRWLGPVAGVLVAAIGGGAAVWLVSRRAPRSLAVGALLSVVVLAAGMRILGVGSGQVGVQPGLSSGSFSPIVSFADSLDRTIVTEWSDQDVEAATWLADNAAAGDLIATNVTFSPLVPALTGMRTLASGVLYQAPYGRPADLPTLLERERSSWDFVDGPSRETTAPLCSAGVRWVWVDPTRTSVRDWEPFASVAFANRSVSVLRLHCA